jgi:hypothetical protein
VQHDAGGLAHLRGAAVRADQQAGVRLDRLAAMLEGDAGRRAASMPVTFTPRRTSAPAATAASISVWQCFGWPRQSGPGTPSLKTLSGSVAASAAAGSSDSS